MSHAEWEPAHDRADPVDLIERDNKDRLTWLVPLRRARMLVSPLSFYRGAASIMAADLAGSPSNGLDVQLCGDAHLSNFGTFATPERTLAVDINDFDETLPGPWEWDLKRLAASFTVTARQRDLPAKRAREITRSCVEEYRSAVREFAAMSKLDVWYSRLSFDDLYDRRGWILPSEGKKKLDRFAAKARSRDNLKALSKLSQEVDDNHFIRSDPPLLLPLRELPDELDPPALEAIALESYELYKASLNEDRRFLLDHYEPVDMALKVVGVGSVGTRCLILLLMGHHRGDALFLQIKEASSSVLEEHLAPSTYDNHGQRVVEGQRLMQAHSDIFLGWSTARTGRHFYWRQLQDWKGSINLETATPEGIEWYAKVCGWTLARAHSRTGDPIALAAYLGSSSKLDDALAEFAQTYADLNERDYARYVQHVADHQLELAPL